jgi:hypothetical protein
MHELAVLDAPGRITFIEADGGGVVGRARAPREALALTWSRDGRRLLAVGRRGWRLYDGQGRLLVERDAAEGVSLLAGELSPSGRQVALLAQRQPRAGRAAVREATLGPTGRGAHASRVLMAGHELTGVRFSPDGRWLLVEWPRSDSWFFFATTPGDERSRVITGLTTRLSERRPLVDGWCCTATR